MEQLIIGGFELSYTVRGNGRDAIVIGSAVYYPRTFSKDLHHDFRMVYMDHRGFGKLLQPYNDDLFKLEVIVEDIEALRIQLGLEKVVIIGHSGHGYMALEYAKKYPHNVSHIVLIAMSPIGGAVLFEMADRYFTESVCPARKELLADNLKTLEGDIQANSEKAFIIRMLKFGPMIWYQPDYDATGLWKDVDVISEAFDYLWGKIFFEIDITTYARQLEIPIFLSLGRYDYWNPPHLWESVRNNFKNLTIRVFERSGHTPQFEEPDLFNNELLRWLKEE